MENNDFIEFSVNFVRGKHAPLLHGATLILCYLKDGLVHNNALGGQVGHLFRSDLNCICII